MGTTAIFAEILIIGLEALGWIALAVLAVFGLDAIDLGPIASNEALALLLVVAAAYPLGVIFDRVADSILLGIDPRVDCRTARYRRRPIEHINTMRIHLLNPELGIADFLEYQRSRIRVARGTVFNLFATILAAGLFLVLQRSQFNARDVGIGLAAVILGGSALTVGMYHVYRRIADAQVRMLNRAYRILVEREGGKGGNKKPQGGEERDDERQIVAGVVHRQTPRGVEFLLVRTKDGCHWTFPKGHVKHEEDPRDAVTREVLEESGARGTIAPAPLATYRYPATRRHQTEDSDVAAYLVEFRDMGESDERRRIGWFRPESARAKLAEGRSKEHAAAAGAVIETALAAIPPPS